MDILSLSVVRLAAHNMKEGLRKTAPLFSNCLK